MISIKRIIFINAIAYIIVLLLIPTAYAISMDSDIIPKSVSLYHDQSQTISGTVTNFNAICSMSCQYYNSNKDSWTTIGTLGTGNDDTKDFTFSLIAPSTDSKTENVQIIVYCQESSGGFCDGEDITESHLISFTYGPSPEESQALSNKNAAGSAIDNARNLISQAQTVVSAAQNKINELKNIGAPISSASLSLESANTQLQNANTHLANANSAFGNGEAAINTKSWTTASSYLNTALSSAQQAQTNANNAKNKADEVKAESVKIIEEWNRKQQEAVNKVSDANSEIDTANLMIQKGDKIINNATILGLDTAAAKAQLAEARAKIEAARNYHKEASSAIDIKNFDGAKSKAELAISNSKDAQNLASIAYNSLEYQVTVAGESAKAIGSANSEISQMNEILSKMDYVLLSTEKQGVDVTQTKNVVATAKTNVDSAEDLLSQAKNRVASGVFSQAADLGIKARDKAASSRNRLDTMSQTLSISIQQALETRLASMQAIVAEAESEVNSAAGTYGIDADAMVNAQNELSSAKNKLSESQSRIEKVKVATGLTDLLKDANAAFQSLDVTEETAEQAISSAKAAKMGLVKKVAIGGAVVAGAAGGGFLFYRMRKKKKAAKAEHKHETKEEVKKEKK